MKKILFILMAFLMPIVTVFGQTKIEYVKYSDGLIKNVKETSVPVDTFSIIGIDSLTEMVNKSIFLRGGDTVDLGGKTETIEYEGFTRVIKTKQARAFYNENRNYIIPNQRKESTGFAWELIAIVIYFFMLIAILQKNVVVENLVLASVLVLVLASVLVLVLALVLASALVLVLVSASVSASVSALKTYKKIRNVFIFLFVIIQTIISIYVFPNTEELLYASIIGIVLGLLTIYFWRWWKDSLSEDDELKKIRELQKMGDYTVK